jgi:lysophospholipase L1-like esterase
VAERLPRLVEVRAKIADIAKRHAKRGVELVDLHAATEKRPEVFDVDGVHLNAAGYKLLAETLRPHVEAAARQLAAPASELEKR